MQRFFEFRLRVYPKIADGKFCCVGEIDQLPDATDFGKSKTEVISLLEDTITTYLSLINLCKRRRIRDKHISNSRFGRFKDKYL